jgi:hypothetical protein
MLTAACIAVAFCSGYAIGLPVLWIARRGQPLLESDWLWAPIVGVGTAVLCIHQLVYLDITVARSTSWFWAVIVVAWVSLLCRFGWRALFQNCPRSVLAAACLVYLIQGLGLLRLGVELYSGRAYTDRSNYIALSQFTMEAPFSLTWENLEQRAYLADGLKLKNERIGVASFQAFIACTLGVPAADTFDPVMLLGPALLVPAIVLLARRFAFSLRESVLIGVTGSLLPGLATVQLSSYLGQVVAIPFLFAGTVAVCDLVGRWTFRRLCFCAFLSAATVAIYTEFTPILLAILVGATLIGVWIGTLTKRGTLYLTLGLLLAIVAIYPSFILESQYQLVVRTSLNTAHAGWPLSWLAGFNEFGAIWVSDQMTLDHAQPRRGVTIAFGVLLTAYSLFGLMRYAWPILRTRLVPSGLSPEGGILAVIAAAIGLGPFLLFASPRFEYQIVKLMLAVSQIWVLGLALELRRLSMAGGGEPLFFTWRRYALFPGGLLLLSSVFAQRTGNATSQVGSFKPIPFSLHSHLLENPALPVRRQLEQYRGESIVLACGPGSLWNSHLSYAARHNRVWLVNPTINDNTTLGFYRLDGDRVTPGPGRELVDLSTVPSGAIVVMRTDDQKQVTLEGSCSLLWEEGFVQAWRVGPGPFHLVPTENAQRPKELDRAPTGHAARME